MKTKKILLYALFCLAALASFSACNKDEEEPDPVQPEKTGPLCFTAEQDSSFVGFFRSAQIPFPDLEYSRDGESWEPFTIDSSDSRYINEVMLPKVGDKIYVRNRGKANTFSISPEKHFQFYLGGFVSASGNLMSLIDKDCNTLEVPCDYAFYALFANCFRLVSAPELPATTLTQMCYGGMFYNCNILRKGPSSLPANVLKPYCYEEMFWGCKKLEQMPTIAATTLASNCFFSAFEGCTSLNKVSALPATTLADSCYYRMFYGCTSLTTAPELPATTLANECYAGMFEQCSSLQKAPKVLPATTMKDKCYFLMFSECHQLEIAPELPATDLAYGCYYGMFNRCYNLRQVQESLPASTLAEDCYGFMFASCSSLTSLPAIEATTVGYGSCYVMFDSCVSVTQYTSPLRATVMDHGCYAYMFAECWNLATLPELPATTLAESCYEAMFYGCAATRAPRLPATTLASNCYAHMFEECANLNYVEVAFNQWPTESATTDWLNNVQPSGTFVCPANLPDERGTSRIPAGWTKSTSAKASNMTAAKSSLHRSHPAAKRFATHPALLKSNSLSIDRNLYRVNGL